MDALNFAKNIPPWLDQELFERAFRSSDNDPQAQVHSFEVKQAVQPGENFASAIFRGAISYSSKYTNGAPKDVSVIIKTQPVGVDLPNMEHLNDPTLFINEIAVYTEILPQIKTLLESVGETDILNPRLIYQTMKPKPVIILEDVSVLGYDTMIKQPHQDFERSKQIFRRLAKLHAASFFLEQEMRIDLARFNTSLFRNFGISQTMYDESIDVFIEALEGWEGFERYVEPVREFRRTYFEKALKSYTPSKGEIAINVLNHGDFHLKNLLYKLGENGKVEDFVFLDYQISVYCTPAVDLYYALYNFVSDDNRLSRYNEILKVYHDQFLECLTQFGFLRTPPSLLEFHIDLVRNGNIRAYFALCIYPFIATDMNNLTAEDFAAGPRAFKKKMIENEYFRELMRKELPLFLKKGFLK